MKNDDVISPNAKPGLFSTKWLLVQADTHAPIAAGPGLAKTKPKEEDVSYMFYGRNRQERRANKSKKGGDPTYDKSRRGGRAGKKMR